MRTVLIEASPWNPATGAVVSTALAGGGVKAYTHRSRNDWLAGVTAEPKFSAKIEFDESGFQGGARPEYGVLEWTPGDPTKLELVANLLWDGADIEVRVGDDELPVPVWTILLIGVVEAQAVRGGKLSLKVRDKSAELDVPVAQDRFAGSGGIEGDAFVAERLKRRAFGYCNNVEALPLKSATNIYELADPAFPLYEISDVKDIGRSASSLALVGWQGSIAATLAALEAYSVPSGGGAVAPSIACLKWWTQPVGPLTADIVGQLGTGLQSEILYLAVELLETRSTLSISNFAGAHAARNVSGGLYVDSESETIAQALDRLLKGVSMGWTALADGTLEVREIKLTGPVETLKVIDAARTRSFKPLKRRRVGFLRNHRIHTEAEIASALRDDAGAVLTAGADWSTNVTSRPANLAALVGSEGVNNAGVSISSGGALAGAGGGQVTIGGLGYAGSLTATAGVNLIPNPTSEEANPLGLGAVAVYGSFAYAGTKSRLVGNLARTTIARFPASAGDQVFATGMTRGNSGALTRGALLGAFRDASGTEIQNFGYHYGNTTTDGNPLPLLHTGLSWGQIGVMSTAAPAGTVDCEIYLYSDDGVDGSFFDNLFAQRMNQWTTGIVGRPTNLAALAGSEGINNAAVSISAGGALAGAGGGQVTIGGIAPNLDPYATRGENLAINGDFSQGQTGYFFGLGATYQTLGGAGEPGPHGVSFPANTAFAYINGASQFPIKPGMIYVGGDFLGGAGVNTVTAGVIPYDSAGNQIGSVLTAILPDVGTAYAKRQAAIALPATTARVQVYFQKTAHASATVGTNFFASSMELGADVTSYIDGPAELLVQASSAGVPLTGQLPKSQAFKLWRNGVDVTALAAWSIAPLAGVMTETVGAATGVAEVDLDGGVLTSGRFRLTAVYQGLTRTKDVIVTRADAAPPSGGGGGGGGGSGASGSISGTVNSTTPVVISDVLTVDTGSGGQAALSATYGFSSSGVPAKHLMTRWQQEIASVWTDVGSAKQSDVGAFTTGAPEFDSGEGQGTHSETIGSLGANTTGHKFRLTGYTPSGTVARFPYGDVGATGS